MFNQFDHYLSYGATDQATLRNLTHRFDGLVVPGTVAAFQKQGTGGFVLTLSVASAQTPYVVDPRFPLFQQRLSGKQSQLSLAAVLGDEELVRADAEPSPDDFDDERVYRIARAWVRFNEEYPQVAGEKFDKYAERLGEALPVESGQDPEAILPPYFVALSGGDDWSRISRAFETATRENTARDVVPVYAVDDVRILGQELAGVYDSQGIVWVSDLNELTAPSAQLSEYARAIRAATQRRVELFALYGGFFAVLLSSIGLKGASHGIGFSESRAWIELPQSGPPPRRFYLPSAHRYIAQDLAQRIYGWDSELAACSCEVCDGRAPLVLDYHELMQHSVACRHQEITEWSHLGVQDVAERLDDETTTLLSRKAAIAGHLEAFGQSAVGAWDHLPRWVSALKQLHVDE